MKTSVLALGLLFLTAAPLLAVDRVVLGEEYYQES